MTASSRKLYYLGKPADGFGWGVANTNLVAELSKLCEVVVSTDNRDTFDAPVFVPVADSALNPLKRVKKAPRVLGYCFAEWPLTDKAERNARQYDVLFAGSTWNTEKLKASGIKHAQTLVQGIDFERFKPLPPSDRKGFVVFSGGKYEFRKGQDYVLRAMRHFMQHRADVVLIAAWHNPWPQTMASMQNSWLIDPAKPFDGLPEDRVIKIPPVSNAQTPEIYKQAHIGLFPNRCEAGTNLVMCEFMACSRPVIATAAHGHNDVLSCSACNSTGFIEDASYSVDDETGQEYICDAECGCGSDGPFKLTNGSLDAAGWFNTNVSDIIAHLEHAYLHREELQERGKQCRKLVERLRWEDCAKKIYDAAFL